MIADALELLAEPPGLRSFPLAGRAAPSSIPGTLGFPDEWVYANFVSTIDGVVALPGVAGSNRLIADASEADRLVMGLLRACADVVLIGAGTLRGSPRAVWTAEAAYPDAAAAFARVASRARACGSIPTSRSSPPARRSRPTIRSSSASRSS